MTYTLSFRVTREVWDALERGEKTTEYRDDKPFWRTRMNRALAILRMGNTVDAIFIGPPKQKGGPWTKARYSVGAIRPPARHITKTWEQKYLHAPIYWAVELGRRIE